MALAVQLRHTVRVVTAVRAELLAWFDGAKAGRVCTLFWTLGLMFFSKHTLASLLQDGNESVPITTRNSMRLRCDNAQVRSGIYGSLCWPNRNTAR
jgi:hypothetical protein